MLVTCETLKGFHIDQSKSEDSQSVPPLADELEDALAGGKVTDVILVCIVEPRNVARSLSHCEANVTKIVLSGL